MDGMYLSESKSARDDRVGIDGEDNRLHNHANAKENQMRFLGTYRLTILVGIFVAFIISILVGRWFPQASLPIFIVICILGFFLGWVHAKSTKSHAMKKKRLMEFESNAEEDLTAIKSIILLSPDFSIGGYTLNSLIQDGAEIKELSGEEYLVLEKKFENEVIYKAPPVSFHNQKWIMFIGAVAGKIYKLHLNSTFLTDEEAFHCNAVICYSFETRLGEATDKSFEDHAINHIWDTPYGNIHLGYIRLGSTYNINISATSNIVRTFDPLS